MCLGFLSYCQFEEYPIIILNNRDEQVSRPTIPLHEWDNSNNIENGNKEPIKIYGGKDKSGGGTWLAVNNNGKFCMILNSYYKHKNYFLGIGSEDKISRGAIVYDYLKDGTIKPLQYITEIIDKQRNRYQPFILVLGDLENAYHYSSHQIPDTIELSDNVNGSISDYNSSLNEIEKGTLFGVSNYPVSWNVPRVNNGKQLLDKELSSIFGTSNHQNGANANIILDESKENKLLEIMMNNQTESEPSVPMEDINVSAIFVSPYTSKFTNKLRSTVSTSLITLNNITTTNNNNTDNRLLLNFTQIDHTINKTFKLSTLIN